MSQNSQTQSIAPISIGNRAEISAAFVLRLTWDANTLNWQILLRSANQEEIRIFTSPEGVVLHLESWMAKQLLNRGCNEKQGSSSHFEQQNPAFHSERSLLFDEETQTQ